MTAPRPEAVELARGLLTAANMRIIPDGGLDLHDLEPHFIEWIDAALTAARADERERAAKCCDEYALAKRAACAEYEKRCAPDQSDNDMRTQAGTAEHLAAAIRAMEGR